FAWLCATRPVEQRLLHRPANLDGIRIRPGRLQDHAETDSQPRLALRLLGASGRRQEPPVELRPHWRRQTSNRQRRRSREPLSNPSELQKLRSPIRLRLSAQSENGAPL